MIDPLLQFFLSAIVLVPAGIYLVKSSDQIGDSLKLGKLFVGSLLLAGATSLPELLVDVSAIQQGMPDLAVGDLLGSSLMNILILAIADLLHKNPKKMFSRASAQHALSSTISISLTVITAIFILLGPRIAMFDLVGVGLGPILIGLTYLFSLRLLYHSRPKDIPVQALENAPGPRLLPAIGIYLLSAVAIFIVAPYLSEAAGEIADKSGLGKTFVGTTLVAFCTSLPELVSTLTAVRMGAFDLAVGNIFGSNSFNMVLLIPLDFVYAGNLLASISPSHLLISLSVIYSTSLVAIGQLYPQEKRVRFIEPDALLVMLVILSSLFLLYWY